MHDLTVPAWRDPSTLRGFVVIVRVFHRSDIELCSHVIVPIRALVCAHIYSCNTSHTNTMRHAPCAICPMQAGSRKRCVEYGDNNSASAGQIRMKSGVLTQPVIFTEHNSFSMVCNPLDRMFGQHC